MLVGINPHIKEFQQRLPNSNSRLIRVCLTGNDQKVWFPFGRPNTGLTCAGATKDTTVDVFNFCKCASEPITFSHPNITRDAQATSGTTVATIGNKKGSTAEAKHARNHWHLGDCGSTYDIKGGTVPIKGVLNTAKSLSPRSTLCKARVISRQFTLAKTDDTVPLPANSCAALVGGWHNSPMCVLSTHQKRVPSTFTQVYPTIVDLMQQLPFALSPPEKYEWFQ